MATSSIGYVQNPGYVTFGGSGNVTVTNCYITTNSTNAISYVTVAPAGWTGNYVVTGAFQWSQPSAEELAARSAADEAAEQLVRDLVGAAGYAAFKKSGYIQIDSQKRAGVVYRIKRDAIDLYERKDGKIIDLKQWLCVHPKYEPGGVYPAGDEVATRILLARFAEDDLWRTANLHHKRAA